MLVTNNSVSGGQPPVARTEQLIIITGRPEAVSTPPPAPPSTLARTTVTLATFDWIVVLVGIVVSLFPAIGLAKRAGSSTAEFFTTGRSVPWWLVGISMVATTFSTDAPNLVTNLVRNTGGANNWGWWSFLLTGMMTVLFCARLWRRSNMLTDPKFYEIRIWRSSAEHDAKKG